ncbi:trimethylamine---corrinoid protein Co-methyltransferase [Tistlia consotensis]|uniref:Methyltransferase n=1 Tax=Tistlia consotensis USBA 355 TaxID=560819 RepID=A0A1Y6BRD7_9PROT|nr:trimethylamine methyltransferase family protein [Tistlia consotensis]SMF24368.1 trimethylamine---corrinoid protein Co-methyltransferase [Tistlia consotensis USBA 355]SNR60618.1 trimethylamine---corrinoid protein Co-methyltransferase [Tistlia consotensis]
MSVVEEGGARRRRGGRESKHAERAAALAEDIRPIRPGLPGGWYKPLTDAGVARINEAVLEVLEDIGIGQAIPSCVEACTALGAVYENGRLRFPRALVEDVVARAARNFPLCAQVPELDLHPGGSRVHFGTAGAAVHLVDPVSREYRESTLQDIYDAARMVEVLDNIHFFQRPMVPRDLPDPTELDVNTLYACLAGTRKHVGVSFTSPQRAQLCLEMLHVVAGGEARWRERPFVSNSNCHVVPPLKFGEDASAVLEVCVRGGMPVLLLSAGQAGATAPAAIAGAVVQAVAEVLAGLVYVNALVPGAPAIFGTWPFVSDLRTGSMSGGSGEQALLTAACGQMAQFYDLPGGSAAGMTDAKLPDMQSGFEKGITEVMAGLAGTNLIYEAAGMHASLLGFCLESLVIDNDVIGQALRCVRGIEVTEDSLSLEAMRRVCLTGPGHYLGDAQTIHLMQRDYVYPRVADRKSPKEWEELGSKDVLERAIEEKQRILSTVFPGHLPPAVDAELRARFPVRLPREAMRRG